MALVAEGPGRGSRRFTASGAILASATTPAMPSKVSPMPAQSRPVRP
jgi:hypothetical protein